MVPEQVKSTLKTTTAAQVFYTAATLFAEEMKHDVPLSHIRAFALIAAAGDEGLEMETLGKRLDVLSGQVSRITQNLGAVHQTKDQPGFGLIERHESLADLRRKSVRLSAKGKKLAAKLAETLGR